MATYYDIFGQKVQYLSSDPANLTEGQVWYNSTSNTAKVQGYSAFGSFSSGSTMNTARGGFYGGAGSGNTDALIGGVNPTPAVEQYDGTSWTNKTGPGSSADQRSWWGDSSTAAAQVAGLIWPTIQTATEEWNGSAWTTGGSLTHTVYTGHATGSVADAIYWGGFSSPGAMVSSAAVYDGTSWTNSPNTPEAAGYSGGGFGTGAAAVGYSGYAGTPTIQSTTAYEWNDVSWTTTNPVNTRVQYGNGFGIQTAGVKVGGGQPPGAPLAPNSTETYDGTCFSINPNQLSNLRGGGAGAGTTNASGIYAGGGPPTTNSATEEWNGAGPITKTITTS